MRDILFKAKRKDNGEWVEGQYSYIRNPYSEDGEPVTHLICNGTNVFNYEIDPDTLCQYTGLKDKNGNRIWENDIVKDEPDYMLGTVIWHCDDYVGWFLDDEYFEHPQMIDKEMWGNCEVIGNIFDIPELLKPDTPTES